MGLDSGFSTSKLVESSGAEESWSVSKNPNSLLPDRRRYKDIRRLILDRKELRYQIPFQVLQLRDFLHSSVHILPLLRILLHEQNILRTAEALDLRATMYGSFYLIVRYIPLSGFIAARARDILSYRFQCGSSNFVAGHSYNIPELHLFIQYLGCRESA